MAFLDDVRLPEDVERGAVGGPGFNTTVMVLTSGFERRNRNWSRTRGTWDIGYGIDRKSQLEGVIDTFYAVGGKADGFRFKDWSDFQIGNTFTFDVDTRQTIGLGDDSTPTFQIFKRYTRGSTSFDREIKKVVDNTYKIYLDGVLQIETTEYTIDINTGIVTFVTPPASTGGSGPGGEEVVSVICEFDAPVRFDSDQLNVNTQIFSDEAVISIPGIKIIEIRV
jgi:uncharacterized protein (TIGR02217 family)